jgi:hypothetical protein
MASSLGMKPGFIIMNQKPNGRGCSHFLVPKKKDASRCPLPGMLLLTVFWDSQGQILGTLYGEGYHGNKCQLLRSAER